MHVETGWTVSKTTILVEDVSRIRQLVAAEHDLLYPHAHHTRQDRTPNTSDTLETQGFRRREKKQNDRKRRDKEKVQGSVSMVTVAVCSFHSLSLHFSFPESHHHVDTTSSQVG